MNNPRFQTPEWKLLTTIQNAFYPNQDIMSITGFMDDDQLLDHVYGYYKQHEDTLRKLGYIN